MLGVLHGRRQSNTVQQGHSIERPPEIQRRHLRLALEQLAEALRMLEAELVGDLAHR